MAVETSATPISSWHVRRAGRILPAMAALAAPTVALFYLLAHPDRDTVIETYPMHFYAVTIVSVVGFVISGVVTLASARLREARAFFLNLGFLSISGIFFIHALATPGILMAESHPVVGLAARLSLLSWWGYHGLMLVGFIVSLVGFGLTYGRKRSLAGLLETLFLTDTIDRIESSYSEALFALVAAVEARDQYTKGHSARVSQIAVLVGEALRLPGEQLRSLGRAGLVHDVGKLSVPDSILSKPGRLTEEEYVTVKRHPLWGYEVIQKIESLRGDLPGVLHHHERYDGGGYPSGLAGEEIPLQARILSVADVFDALTSERPYRTAHTGGEALAHLRHMAGTQFDPAVVGAFERVLDQWQERRRRLGM